VLVNIGNTGGGLSGQPVDIPELCGRGMGVE
jgi:hypothetical protein